MIKKLRKSLILSCVLALLVPSIASADMNVTRISGKDRYETALMVQRKHFTKANRKLAVIACLQYHLVQYQGKVFDVLYTKPVLGNLQRDC